MALSRGSISISWYFTFFLWDQGPLPIDLIKNIDIKISFVDLMLGNINIITLVAMT